MAAPIYDNAHRRACANAIAALGNRIGLYTSAGARVGTVYADTTWGAAVDGAGGDIDKAIVTGSTATISVPGGTVANGTIVSHYSIHNGSTFLRRKDLPVSLTINDGSKAFDVDITPILQYRGE